MRERWHEAVERLDGWLFAPEAAGRVRAMRLLLALLIGARLATGPYRGLSGQPAALFRPVWFLAWLDHMPSAGVLVGIEVVGLVGAALAVAAWHERWTFAAAWGSLLVLSGCRASRGKVQHNDLPCSWWPGCWRGAGRAAAARRATVGGLGLAGAHEPRGRGGRVRPQRLPEGHQQRARVGAQRQPAQRHVRARFSGHAPTDSIALYIGDRPWLAHLVALATLVIELGAVVVIVRPRPRPAYLAAVTALHLSIFLTHGLDYSMWVGTAAVVLIDWDAVLRRTLPRPARSPALP